jgi:hypothetical protein
MAAISAGILMILAKALAQPIGYFFEYEESELTEIPPKKGLKTNLHAQFLKDFSKIKGLQQQKTVIDLINHLMD